MTWREKEERWFYWSIMMADRDKAVGVYRPVQAPDPHAYRSRYGPPPRIDRDPPGAPKPPCGR
jgi:hypothetical protein